jgi:hypothetical protein
LIPPPSLQDEWLTGQERHVRDEARTRRHKRRTQTDLAQGMQPLFPPSLANTHIPEQLTTLQEGVEPSQEENAIKEHSETDASEGAHQRARIGRRVRPPIE